ncbi:MAG: hypothetical protein KGJ77_01820 [Acidobacteriota bacterium]|nr:hypothetical protein [Acidobacteriota bacterium]
MDEAPQFATPPPGRRRMWPKVAAAAGIAAGSAAGAAVLAAAATSGPQTTVASAGTDATSGSSGSSSSSGSSGSSSTTTPATAPRGRGWGMGMHGPGFGGDVLHGVYTVQGPNGYETLQVQTGTVSAISDTAGSTWSMTVTSADGTPLTYVIDSGTSVDGGETGVSSISKGDTVHVEAVVSNGTATAKEVADSTVMGANGQSWRPAPPNSSSSSSSGTTTS